MTGKRRSPEISALWSDFASSSFWKYRSAATSLRSDLVERVRKLQDSYYTDRQWLEEFWSVLTLAAWFDRYIARIR